MWRPSMTPFSLFVSTGFLLSSPWDKFLIQDDLTKKGFLLNWCFNHPSRHWFLSILTFSSTAILFLFCKPSNPQHLSTCTCIQFCFSALSWSVTLILLQPHYFWAFPVSWLASCSSFWDCQNSPHTVPANRKRTVEIKMKTCSWSLKGWRGLSPCSQCWLVWQLAQLNQDMTKPPQGIFAWQQMIRRCFTT